MNKDIHEFLIKKLNTDVFSVIKEFMTIDDKISLQLISKIKKSEISFRDDYNKVYSFLHSFRVFREEVKIKINETNRYMIFTYTHYIV